MPHYNDQKIVGESLIFKKNKYKNCLTVYNNSLTIKIVWKTDHHDGALENYNYIFIHSTYE